MSVPVHCDTDVGKEKTLLDNVITLSKNMNIAYIEAMEALNLSKEEQEYYLKLLNN